MEENKEIDVSNDEDLGGYVLHGLVEAERVLERDEVGDVKTVEMVVGDDSGRPHLERSSSSTPFRVASSCRERSSVVSLRTLSGGGVLAVRWEVSEADVMAVEGKVMTRSQTMLVWRSSLKVQRRKKRSVRW